MICGINDFPQSITLCLSFLSYRASRLAASFCNQLGSEREQNTDYDCSFHEAKVTQSRFKFLFYYNIMFTETILS